MTLLQRPIPSLSKTMSSRLHGPGFATVQVNEKLLPLRSGMGNPVPSSTITHS
jgi:hypothetical protein